MSKNIPTEGNFSSPSSPMARKVPRAKITASPRGLEEFEEEEGKSLASLKDQERAIQNNIIAEK